MQQSSIRRVAVAGTGTIGMSWAATFLSRGLKVTASDPAPDVEARLRQFIDAAGVAALPMSIPRSARGRGCAGR